MKTQKPTRIGTDDLLTKFKQSERETERLREQIRRREGELRSARTQKPANDVLPPRRNLTITPVHRAISRLTQTLRHAMTRKGVSKTEIARLKKELKQQQTLLQKQNAGK
jgi:hypothetical protein